MAAYDLPKQTLEIVKKNAYIRGGRALSEPKFRTECPFFSREKWPEFRRKRDLHEPLLTAMAQALPFLIQTNPKDPSVLKTLWHLKP